MQVDQKGCDQSNQAHGPTKQAQGSKLWFIRMGTLI